MFTVFYDRFGVAYYKIFGGYVNAATFDLIAVPLIFLLAALLLSYPKIRIWFIRRTCQCNECKERRGEYVEPPPAPQRVVEYRYVEPSTPEEIRKDTERLHALAERELALAELEDTRDVIRTRPR